MQANLKKHLLDIRTSGFQHHNFELEKMISDTVLLEQQSGVFDWLNLETYADVLAPDRLRAMKNGLICYIAIVSRSAIQRGVDAETSFSTSDYFINEIELCADKHKLEALLEQIQKTYISLVREGENRTFSLPVIRAIRYINRKLYEPCPVSDVAKNTGLNPQYFARLFKSETGQNPSDFIRQKKMQEAKKLLLETGVSVCEVADILGFCDSAHFICMFRKEFGQTPKKFALGKSLL